MPIRVAVVMGKYVTGGIKSVVFNYYTAINKGKVQFDLIVNKDKKFPDKDFSDFTSQGAKIFEVTAIEENPVKNIIETTKILKNGKYKIVHGYLNTLNIFPMFAGFLAGTRIRIAENLSTAHPKEPKTLIKTFLKPFSSFFSTKQAANSVYAAEWIFGKRKAKKALILRNGLDLEIFTYSPKLREDRRKQLGLSNEFLIGHVGRYQFQKNHDFIIDIFSQIMKLHPNSKLLLIGYGELKDEIWKKIEKLGLQKFVIDGGASTDNIANYNAMDCFLLPSYYEGLPVVGIEAQATGLPCVFSTEVTREAKLVDAVSYVSLNESALKWAKEVMKFLFYKRNNNNDQIKQQGYDIKIESKLLVSYYMNTLEDMETRQDGRKK